jgi:hypothetical protein
VRKHEQREHLAQQIVGNTCFVGQFGEGDPVGDRFQRDGHALWRHRQGSVRLLGVPFDHRDDGFALGALSGAELELELWIPRRVCEELERQQVPGALLLEQVHEQLSRLDDLLTSRPREVDALTDVEHLPVDVLVEHREEEVFLAREVRVDSALREARYLGDLVERRGGETPAGEHVCGGVQEAAPSASLLLVTRRFRRWFRPGSRHAPSLDRTPMRLLRGPGAARAPRLARPPATLRSTGAGRASAGRLPGPLAHQILDGIPYLAVCDTSWYLSSDLGHVVRPAASG